MLNSLFSPGLDTYMVSELTRSMDLPKLPTMASIASTQRFTPQTFSNQVSVILDEKKKKKKTCSLGFNKQGLQYMNIICKSILDKDQIPRRLASNKDEASGNESQQFLNW